MTAQPLGALAEFGAGMWGHQDAPAISVSQR